MSNGDIYFWEPEKNRGYSIGWNLKKIIDNGLPNFKPPKKIEDFLEQILILIKTSEKEWSGPITFNSFDNYLASYVKDEKPSRHQLIKQIEYFFNNIKGRDVVISLDLIARPEINFTSNTKQILDSINDVIHEVYQRQMEKGIFEPLIVINLFTETDWNSTILDKWIQLSYQFGQPNYQNFITGTISPETVRPRAYKPEKSVVYLRVGGIKGNSEDQSVSGFASINLAKIATLAKNEKDFFKLVDELFDNVVELLEERKNRIKINFLDGRMTLTRHFIDNLDWSFSVITLVGMNEALETLIDASLGNVAGKAITYKLLEHLLRRIEETQKLTGNLYSLESFPSENAGALLLKEYDSKQVTLTAATDLKSDHGDDLWDVLEHQKKFHSIYTGGTLLQIYLDRGLSYNSGLKLLLQRLIEIFGYNYFGITPLFSICPEHGYHKGDVLHCLYCGGETKTYTRIDNTMVEISKLPDSLKEAHRRRVYYDVKNK